MNLLFSLLKFVFVLCLWTAIGQIPIKGQSLENRYHEKINSDKFQKVFWKLATPITWTTQKVQKLMDEQLQKNLPAR